MASLCVFLVCSLLLLLLESSCAQETPLTGSTDICLQPPLKGPCRAIHYRWHYDRYSQTCKQFTYGGCKGNDNNFLDFTECSETCKRIKKVPKICRLENDPGICRGYIARYFFNLRTMRCEKFYYGGCFGNENRFDSPDTCMDFCLPRRTAPSFCYSPIEEGSCSASVSRFYYNARTKTCERFTYSGCGGNNNNFTTEKSCLRICRRRTRKQIL
ncbi:tissue factor pathway inhibitor 2 [Ahaetulla prasina]|uniref:tissue factor pathway inhibitor 2 n=1 Tax=Ahaetulla prasina TaxID=499056 RepID=UPI002649A748|nr:tissue factor pathway inhibitor 2 [Ahaetulla prasina]